MSEQDDDLRRNVQRLAILVEQMLIEMAPSQPEPNSGWADLLSRAMRINKRLGVVNAPIDNATDLPVGQDQEQ